MNINTKTSKQDNSNRSKGNIQAKMGKTNRARKLRGSQGVSFGDSNNETYDLMVLLPKSGSSLECKLLVKELRDRLASTGFTHMALTHTIYGRPKPEDRVDIAIPSSLWNSTESINNINKKKKRKSMNDDDESTTNHENKNRKKICILRRLHVVVENLSDMGSFLLNGPQEELLNEYDLISICPTNDATFQSACSSATMADIITLDYTTRGVRLPYRIRSKDVKEATERGASFEIPIAPALLHLKQRKALVHSCQELKNNTNGMTKCRIIISSGDRTLDGTDVGALALRMPGDITNLCKTVMHFDGSMAGKVVGLAAKQAVQRGKERRFGQPGLTGSVILMNKVDWTVSRQSEDDTIPDAKRGRQSTVESKQPSNDTEDDDGDLNDDIDEGFIAM